MALGDSSQTRGTSFRTPRSREGGTELDLSAHRGVSNPPKLKPFTKGLPWWFTFVHRAPGILQHFLLRGVLLFLPAGNFPWDVQHLSHYKFLPTGRVLRSAIKYVLTSSLIMISGG